MRPTCLLTIATFVLLGVASGQAQDSRLYDTYGGYRPLSDSASGFFRLGQIDGRHYLITPSGHAYRALGINHFHNMTGQDYDGAVRNIRRWGFNAGCYQGPRWMWDRYPYTQGINLVEMRSYLSKEKFRYEDVFDPVYLDTLAARIRRIAEPQADNKLLIGYFLTDMPAWSGNQHGTDWISFLRSLPEGAPGRQAWEEWRQAHPAAPREDFLGLIARQLYSKGYEYLRRYDPNHLIFSDRYREEDVPEVVIREVLPFVDALATQPSATEWFDRTYFAKLYQTYGKPIYIADHVTSFATEEHPVTMGQIAQDPATYMERYEDYVTTALSLPYIIGINKCQYQDEPRPTLLKQGLVRQDGSFYPVVDGVRAANREALRRAYQQP